MVLSLHKACLERCKVSQKLVETKALQPQRPRAPLVPCLTLDSLGAGAYWTAIADSRLQVPRSSKAGSAVKANLQPMEAGDSYSVIVAGGEGREA